MCKPLFWCVIVALNMADLAGVETRHAAVVRITHWIHTFTFLALLVSGLAILMAHPRLYWGETGGFGSPAWMDLPIPLNLDQSGWGRSLHFLAAWIAVLNGTLYVLFGLLTDHYRSSMRPAYNVLQRFTYLAVVFVLFPLMIATGVAMSPAIGAVLPVIVGFFGGHQSARTIHFFVMGFLLIFLILHIVMVSLAGFKPRVLSMITGRGAA